MGRGMTDVLGLTKYREEIYTLMRDGLADDVGVFDIIPDSISPPAVYIAWGNPWLLPTTFCQYSSAVQLICVAARIEPGGQFTVLEDLVGDVVTVLHSNHIAVRDATSPFPIVLGGVNYLAATINIVSEMGD
jgi:hypothetical protein